MPRPKAGPSGELRKRIIACRRCPRLVAFREGVPARASYSGQDYWRRPVPGFGDLEGRLLVLGLAPAASGGNRTGRPFTGDSSGRFLVRALHKCGFANRPVSESSDDGLTYHDCYLTAVVKCVPPGDKPSYDEFENCSEFLAEEIALMRNLRAVLALGSLSFRSYVLYLSKRGASTKGIVFRHGAAYSIPGSPTLIASYHPSPRNTNSGKLTYEMLVNVIELAKVNLGQGPRKPTGNGYAYSYQASTGPADPR